MTTLDLRALLIEHGHTLVQQRRATGPAGMTVYVCIHRGPDGGGCPARAHVQRGTDTVTYSYGIGRDCTSKEQSQQAQQQREEQFV